MPSWRLCLLIGLLIAPHVAAQQRANHYLGKTANEWAVELSSNDPARRRGAAFALGKCGPRANRFVRDLTKTLQDSDPNVREAAAFALGEIGSPGAQPAVKDLIEVVKNDAAPVARRAAAYALGKFGEMASEGARPLRKALGDEDQRVRQDAAWALGRLGPNAIGPAVPDLIKLLNDTDPLVRRDAAAALGNGGDRAQAAVASLVKTLRDGNPVVRQTAANALGGIGSAAREAIPELNRILQDQASDRDLWREAVFAMAKIGGPGLVHAIPAMRQALQDKDPLMRKVIANSFVNLAQERPEARQALPELLTLLSDDDVEVRRNAAVAIYAMKEGVVERAQQAVPPLVKALQNDPDKDVRLFVSRTFWDFDLQERKYNDLRRTLIQCALKDKERLIRYQLAVMVATNLGPDGKEVTPTLIEFLKDTTISSVEKTTASSSTSGTEQKTGTATVEESGTDDARHVAARALGHVGRAAGPDAKRALEEATHDLRSDKLRSEATKALQAFK